jgi:plastocyanin
VFYIAATPIIALVAGVFSFSDTPATAAETQVAVGDFYFCSPSFGGGTCETTVSAGDTVIWAVAGGFHTVTECDDGFATCPPSGGFDSGQLTTGAEFQQTFDDPGTYYYRCNNHPSLMMGSITVEAQETPTPTPAGSATPTAAPTGTSTPAATTPTPAGVPSTGAGQAGDNQDGMLILLFSGLLAAASAGLLLSLRRA